MLGRQIIVECRFNLDASNGHANQNQGNDRKGSQPSDVWKIHDYITEQRELIDAKCDYRYSAIIFVFARPLRQGWITEKDLERLHEEKIEKIKYMSAFR
jgi:hypothetical protein